MKNLILFFALILISKTSFALNCESIFSEKPSNRELVNALKRIRNFQTFSTAVMINTLSNRMTVVVFDFKNRDKIDERGSIKGHVEELRGFASDLKILFNPGTAEQILVKRFEAEKFPANQLKVDLPTSDSKNKEKEYELEVFKSVHDWISRDGAKLNVLVLPESMLQNFMLTATEQGSYVFKTLGDIITSIDPNSN